MHCLSEGVQKSSGIEWPHALTWRTADTPHISQNGTNYTHFDHQWACLCKRLEFCMKHSMLICPILSFNRETGTFICLLRLLKATPSSYLCQYLSRITRPQQNLCSTFCATRKMMNKVV